MRSKAVQLTSWLGNIIKSGEVALFTGEVEALRIKAANNKIDFSITNREFMKDAIDSVGSGASIMNKLMFFLISSSFGQESNDFSKENKKLFEELSLLSKKKFENEQTSLKSIESLEPKLNKQDVDSLFGLYHRVKYNHYNNLLLSFK